MTTSEALEPGALEKAAVAFSAAVKGHNTWGVHDIETAIRAYLAALPPTPKAVAWPPLIEIGRTLGFFVSVIKSGEPWTAACQVAYDRANIAMQAAYQDLALPPADDVRGATIEECARVAERSGSPFRSQIVCDQVAADIRALASFPASPKPAQGTGK